MFMITLFSLPLGVNLIFTLFTFILWIGESYKQIQRRGLLSKQSIGGALTLCFLSFFMFFFPSAASEMRFLTAFFFPAYYPSLILD